VQLVVLRDPLEKEANKVVRTKLCRSRVRDGAAKVLALLFGGRFVPDLTGSADKAEELLVVEALLRRPKP
jgi:hypothetical protein